MAVANRHIGWRVNCLTTGARFHGYKEPPGRSRHGTNNTSAVFIMTQEAETAATEAALQTPPRRADLLGLAYLATVGIVMTAWIGGLVWTAVTLVMWLMS